MWFAFNILSLTYCTQHKALRAEITHCCDLLSISYLWHTVHNRLLNGLCTLLVVICFQYLIFDILYTTFAKKTISSFVLWFAFNILSLTYCTQRLRLLHRVRTCCDLLSISYLWHTVHNFLSFLKHIHPVVICFQYLIFDILYTTP